VQTRLQPPPKQTQLCCTHHDRTRKSHKQSASVASGGGNHTAGLRKEHFAHSHPTSPRQGTSNCRCPGFCQAEADRQAVPKLGPQKIQKRTPRKRPAKRRCACSFLTDAAAHLQAVFHKRTLLQTQKGRKVAQGAFAQISTYDIYSEVHLPHQLSTLLAGPQAAKGSSRRKISFPRKPLP
jgi:hypothetical protein